MLALAILAGGVLVLSLYVAEVAKRSRPGLLRSCALLPSALAFFALPLAVLDGREEPFLMQAAVCILSMSAFKVLALCAGRGCLADPNLGDRAAFLCAVALPVIPHGFQTYGTDKRRAAALLKLRTAACKLAFFMLLAVTCLASLHYVERVSAAPAAPAGIVAMALATWRVLAYFTAGVALLFQVDGMGDLVDAAALNFFGITAEPHFDRVWMATSFTDLWARRWNLTVSSVLRYAFYEPVVEGRWLLADPRATVPLGAAGPPAPPHQAHRSPPPTSGVAAPRGEPAPRPSHLTVPTYGPPTAVAAATPPSPATPTTPFGTIAADKAPTLAAWLAPAGPGSGSGSGSGSGRAMGPEGRAGVDLGVTPSASSSTLLSESDAASPASSAYGRHSASTASSMCTSVAGSVRSTSTGGGEAPADVSSDADGGLRRRREGASGAASGAEAAAEAGGSAGKGGCVVQAGERRDAAAAAAGGVERRATPQQQEQQQHRGRQQELQEAKQPAAGAPARARPSRARRFLAGVVTFTVSGLWHEFVCYSMTGATTGGYWTLLFAMQAPILMLEGELKRITRPTGLRVHPVLARFITHGIFLLELTLLWYPPMLRTGMLASMVRKGDEVAASLAAAAQLAGRYLAVGGGGAGP